MSDNFAGRSDSVLSPSRAMFAVTPSDTAALGNLPKALYVGTAGNVTLRCVDDSTDVTFRNVPAGSVLRVRASFVRATGTTAQDILAHC